MSRTALVPVSSVETGLGLVLAPSSDLHSNLRLCSLHQASEARDTIMREVAFKPETVPGWVCDFHHEIAVGHSPLVKN